MTKQFFSKKQKKKSAPKKHFRKSTGRPPKKSFDQNKSIPDTALAYVVKRNGDLYLTSTNKKNRFEFELPNTPENLALVNHLVVLDFSTNKPIPDIKEKVHQLGALKDFYRIAVEQFELPHQFNPPLLKETEELHALDEKATYRKDYTALPFVTIDGEDAKDFDDAVYAIPDKNPSNPNGWHIKVAIADVSYYVRPNSELDKEAFLRGNSVYFPGTVIPMLPEVLSNDLCSLRPHQNRPTLIAHIDINDKGHLLKFKFDRGLIKSIERLTYTETQKRFDAQKGENLQEINALYGAYHALKRNREQRDTLDLNMPEHEFSLNAAGEIQNISVKKQLESHVLIEEFMIAANIAAAKTLSLKQSLCLYRCHDHPPEEKFSDFLILLKNLGIPYKKNPKASAHFFHKLLETKLNEGQRDLLQQMILRSQSQASYTIENIGHFGLALEHYCHFTSPIRRYADLIVHRLLIHTLNLGVGGYAYKDPEELDDMASHINITERQAFKAEMSTDDRLIAHYMQHQVGKKFKGRISGMNRFNLFIYIPELGAEGVLPIENMPKDKYHYDVKHKELKAMRSRKSYALGQNLMVTIDQSDEIRGTITMKLSD